MGRSWAKSGAAGWEVGSVCDVGENGAEKKRRDRTEETSNENARQGDRRSVSAMHSRLALQQIPYSIFIRVACITELP
jgi:hypothetical protein